MQVPVASYQGGLLETQGDARREHWKLFERRLDLCSQLGIATIVVACDVTVPLSQQSLDRVRHSLVEVAQAGEKQGVRIAVEFQATAVIGNNCQTMVAMVSEVGSPMLGICWDAFHYYVGPSKPEDLGMLTQQNLFHVQLCDLADVPRELAKDSDRILPGDGDIPLVDMVKHLQSIQYQGAVSIEILNPQIWQVPPRQFGEIGMTALLWRRRELRWFGVPATGPTRRAGS